MVDFGPSCQISSVMISRYSQRKRRNGGFPWSTVLLICKELLDCLKLELVLGYLVDDITLGDDAAVCVNDFLQLEAVLQ